MQNYNLPENFFESLHDFFIQRGFSEQQFREQMVKLGELVVTSAFTKLMKQKPPVSPFSSETEATAYIEKTFSKEEVDTSMAEEGRLLVAEYFKNFGVLESAN